MRVAFFWDCNGTNTTLWLRKCEIPLPVSEILKGFWVLERDPSRVEGMDMDLIWLPRETSYAVFIPPGRISSIQV